MLRNIHTHFNHTELKMSKNAKIFSLLSLLVIFTFACNLPSSQQNDNKNDPNAVFTAAAQTASVQLTEAAASIAETNTPAPLQPPTTAPTATSALPSPTATEDPCDDAIFITDVTVPDQSVFPPGETFTKTWRVRNTGECTWTSDYDLVFVSGEQMNGTSPQAMAGSVNPGNTVDISIDLKAPATEGDYVGNWQIRNNKNVLFAKVYVQIKVSTGEFAVTSVSDMDVFYISGHGAALAAKITVNKAGTVKYHWILRETGQPDLTTSVEETAFSASGSKDISTLWNACPHAGNFKASLYIDEPNHQEFGEVSFNCP